MVEAEEAERRNISRELHDRVGQNLSALNLSLNLVRAQLPAEAAAVIADRLGDAQQLVESSVRQVRDVMADLRPPALDDYGLLAALRTHADASPGASGCRSSSPVTSRSRGSRQRRKRRCSASRRKRSTTFRSTPAQPTSRYGSPHTTAPQSCASPTTAWDSTPTSSPQRATWGLRTMRERAEAVGAKLRIEPRAGPRDAGHGGSEAGKLSFPRRCPYASSLPTTTFCCGTA